MQTTYGLLIDDFIGRDIVVESPEGNVAGTITSRVTDPLTGAPGFIVHTSKGSRLITFG